VLSSQGLEVPASDTYTLDAFQFGTTTRSVVGKANPSIRQKGLATLRTFVLAFIFCQGFIFCEYAV
jgi:hypothetical protein